MRQKLLAQLLKVLSVLTGKRFLYTEKNEYNTLGKTAVLSKYGFWYVGNVYDTSDLAYGIARNGVVEKEETDLVQKICGEMAKKKDLVVYDIGANTGYYSILEAYTHNARTVAFEPLSEHIACIRMSALLNNIEDRVQTFTCGLGDKIEEKTFYLAGTGSSFNEKFLDGVYTNQMRMSLTTLDTVVAKENLLRPDFIKIDVEGYELNVLVGAQNTLKEATPVLFIEVSKSLQNLGRNFINTNYTETFELLESHGYLAYFLQDGALKPHTTKTPGPDGIFMYLFLHKDQHAHIIELLNL